MSVNRVPAPYVDNDPGVYIVCTSANTDYPTAVPSLAKGVILWFETSAADATVIGGRFAISDNSTVQTVTNTSHNDELGYHPAEAIKYDFNRSIGASGGNTLYIHVANNTALAVCRGTWLF